MNHLIAMPTRLPSPHLVPPALAGEKGALDLLARAWLPHVYRWCFRLGGSAVDPEDAAHEVLILMCRRIGTLREPESFPSWLLGITRKVLANHRRRAWWRRWLPGANVQDRPSADGDPHRAAEARQAARRVRAALEALEEGHREVLVLVELEERTGAEAAALLDLPVGTVKSRLRAARAALRHALDDQDHRRVVEARR